MTHKQRKVVLFLVEGYSDEVALAPLLSKILIDNNVQIKVVHGDITADKNVNPQNIISKIYNKVKEQLSDFSLKRSDLQQIIHIVDMDGAYVTDDKVVERSDVKKTIYSSREILAHNADNMRKRNDRKRNNIDRISHLHSINNIPYQVYYMSANLDHVLYNKPNNPDEAKVIDAINFSKKYKGDTSKFIQFMTESSFFVGNTYLDSWKYIKQEEHSLERHTNFGLYLLEIKKSKKQ